MEDSAARRPDLETDQSPSSQPQLNPIPSHHLCLKSQPNRTHPINHHTHNHAAPLPLNQSPSNTKHNLTDQPSKPVTTSPPLDHHWLSSSSIFTAAIPKSQEPSRGFHSISRRRQSRDLLETGLPKTSTPSTIAAQNPSPIPLPSPCSGLCLHPPAPPAPSPVVAAAPSPPPHRAVAVLSLTINRRRSPSLPQTHQSCTVHEASSRHVSTVVLCSPTPP
ncbi:hypothetical protein M0R45_035735 [Rubus argutus]|uniref:Uncharacterized protein n=1 Tax=Rubus argutus TaxID=59490 RepID=A0AAW1VWL1_RUBAR